MFYYTAKQRQRGEAVIIAQTRKEVSQVRWIKSPTCTRRPLAHKLITSFVLNLNKIRNKLGKIIHEAIIPTVPPNIPSAKFAG